MITVSKDEVQSLINAGTSLRGVARTLGVSYSTLRRKIKDLDIKTIRGARGRYKEKPEQKVCCRCQTNKPSSEFSTRSRNENTLSAMCRICSKENSLFRYTSFKQSCVEIKGGECSVCGYDQCNAALDFHHTDPETKSFALGAYRGTAINSEVLAELEKCVLLCSNCHREVHAGFIKI